MKLEAVSRAVLCSAANGIAIEFGDGTDILSGDRIEIETSALFGESATAVSHKGFRSAAEFQIATR